MQQFYYLAVLFVAGGIGSALIVAADLPLVPGFPDAAVFSQFADFR